MKREEITHAYELKRGKKTVYYGTTNDLTEREKVHKKDDDKTFDKMERVSTHKNVGLAKRKERELLTKFRVDNGGKNPLHNTKKNG